MPQVTQAPQVQWDPPALPDFLALLVLRVTEVPGEAAGTRDPRALLALTVCPVLLEL